MCGCGWSVLSEQAECQLSTHCRHLLASVTLLMRPACCRFWRLLASCGHAPAPEECKALADPKAVIERCYGGKLDGSAKYIGDLKC
jgi:hypothetical protein